MVVLEPDDSDFVSSGLKVASVIRFDKIATIERQLITRRLGRLTETTLKSIDQALIAALQIGI